MRMRTDQYEEKNINTTTVVNGAKVVEQSEVNKQWEQLEATQHVIF
jgi:hypothetical protein